MKNSNDIIGKGVGESGIMHQFLADFKKVYDSFMGNLHAIFSQSLVRTRNSMG